MNPSLDFHQIDASESDYLYTAPSHIAAAGTGLFTVVDIYREEKIAEYKGEILSPAEAARRAENGQDRYFMNLPDGTIFDAMTFDGFAKYANDATAFGNSGFRNNARISFDDEGRVCLFATRKISAYHEIFCSYGKRYWKKHK